MCDVCRIFLYTHAPIMPLAFLNCKQNYSSNCTKCNREINLSHSIYKRQYLYMVYKFVKKIRETKCSNNFKVTNHIVLLPDFFFSFCFTIYKLRCLTMHAFIHLYKHTHDCETRSLLYLSHEQLCFLLLYSTRISVSQCMQ